MTIQDCHRGRHPSPRQAPLPGRKLEQQPDLPPLTCSSTSALQIIFRCGSERQISNQSRSSGPRQTSDPFLIFSSLLLALPPQSAATNGRHRRCFRLTESFDPIQQPRSRVGSTPLLVAENCSRRIARGGTIVCIRLSRKCPVRHPRILRNALRVADVQGRTRSFQSCHCRHWQGESLDARLLRSSDKAHGFGKSRCYRHLSASTSTLARLGR